MRLWGLHSEIYNNESSLFLIQTVCLHAYVRCYRVQVSTLPFILGNLQSALHSLVVCHFDIILINTVSVMNLRCQNLKAHFKISTIHCSLQRFSIGGLNGKIVTFLFFAMHGHSTSWDLAWLGMPLSKIRLPYTMST
jgi:hypothetical protein